MIDNDPRRSFEFFQSPVAAGQAATTSPLTLGQIMGIHFLCAVALALSSYWAFKWGPPPEMLPTTGDPQSDAIFARFNEVLEFYTNSPLAMTIIGFATSLLYSTLYWQIGRAMTASELLWHVAQSGMSRFLIVSTMVLLVLTFLQILVPVVFQFFDFIFQVYILIVTLLVYQGANNLPSVGLAILVGILAFMAQLGLIFVILIPFVAVMT